MSTTVTALAPGATMPTSLTSILARVVSVDDYQAAGDGLTDDGPAFQRAAAALGPYGGRILMGAKIYLINTPVVFQAVGVALEGMGIPNAFVPGWGTTLLTTNDAPGFVPFTFTGGATAAIRQFAVSQAHPQPSLVAGVAWAPNPYGFFFNFVNLYNGFEIDDIEFGGIARGIYVNSCGHFVIKSIIGQFYDVGVQIVNCLDTPRLLWARSWPYISKNPNVLKYMQANLDLLLMGRVDGLFVGDMHAFAARSLIHCVQEQADAAGSGSPGGMATFIAGKLSGDQVLTTVWGDGLSTNGGEGANAEWSIAHLDGAPLDATNPAATPLPGGTVLRVSCSGGLNITIPDFASGYTVAEAIHIEGDTNSLDIGAYRHHTPNFNFASPAPAMISVAAATTGYPNVVTLGAVRVYNPRGAAVFGGNGGNASACRHGLLIADGQPVVDGLPYVYTPGNSATPSVALFTDANFASGHQYQAQYGDAGNVHTSQKDQPWLHFGYNGFRFDTVHTTGDIYGPLTIGPYGDVTLTRYVAMTGLPTAKPAGTRQLWNNNGVVNIT